jgi:hypothetical protein
MDYTINIISLVVALLGFGYGIWQSRKISYLKKAVNDNVKGLYKDSQQIIIMAKSNAALGEIAERGRKIKDNIIRLDIINRNLNFKEIDKLKDKGTLSVSEAEEYKRLSSN